MLPIYIIQSGPSYLIHDVRFEDEEAVIISLKAKGCRQENRVKAVEGLVRDGA